MNLTNHARARAQQRGIPPLIVEWLQIFGASEYAHGAVKRYFNKAARRRLAQAVGEQVVDRMGDLLNIYIVEGDDAIVTVAHRTERIRRH